ncbi:MAG: putative coat protein [Gulmivirus nemorisvicinum]|uniref:Coat protein n=1 Tax=Leviviridae sp. TaxID=2027243 RepID=A0ABY3SSH1_9VIRU|nr:MAG: putative coat protein [Leviviridae sp.]
MAVTISNPLVITFNGATKNLAKINQDNYGSEYFLNEGTQSFRVKIRHTKESPTSTGVQLDRHNVELTWVQAASGDIPAITTQAYVVLRDDAGRVAATDLEYVVGALTGLLTTDNVGALFGWVN